MLELAASGFGDVDACHLERPLFASDKFFQSPSLIHRSTGPNPGERDEGSVDLTVKGNGWFDD